MSAVTFQRTPNPNAGKFVVGRPVVDGTASKSYYSVQHAADDPVGSALFGIDGVDSLFMVEDFITVTKRQDVDWAVLAPKVIATIEEHME